MWGNPDACSAVNGAPGRQLHKFSKHLTCQRLAPSHGRHKHTWRNGYFAKGKVAAERSKLEFAHIVVKR
jgi:hypothetical protein